MVDAILIIPLMLTFGLSIIHYYFEVYASHLRKFDIYFISFSSGLFITYIFLSMFPEMVLGIQYLGGNVYFVALWGFVVFHIAEKHVLQHNRQHSSKMRKLVFVRTFAFFINLFIIGMSMVFFFKFGKGSLGYFSFIPILFHVISSSLVVDHLHHGVRESVYGRILSSGSIFLGALLASAFDLPITIYYALFSFITGMLLYIIIRDVLPKHKEGKPTFFIAGIIIYLVIIITERIIFWI